MCWRNPKLERKASCKKLTASYVTADVSEYFNDTSFIDVGFCIFYFSYNLQCHSTLVTQHDSNIEERIITAGQRSHFNITGSKNTGRKVEGFKQEANPQATEFPLTFIWTSHLLLSNLRGDSVSLTATRRSCSRFVA